jgi:hypothetical protein
MMRSNARRALLFVVAFSTPLLLVGCPKKPVPVEDAGDPAPAATPSVTSIAPLADDGPDEANDAAETGPKKWTGPGMNVNQAKIRACCNAMRGTHDPMFFALAAQCDMLANQVGPAGSDPAFNQLRAILKGNKIPGACSGM